MTDLTPKPSIHTYLASIETQTRALESPGVRVGQYPPQIRQDIQAIRALLAEGCETHAGTTIPFQLGFNRNEAQKDESTYNRIQTLLGWFNKGFIDSDLAAAAIESIARKQMTR